MTRRRWSGRLVLAVLALFVSFLYLNNSSLLTEPPGEGPFLVAHRSLGQGFSKEGLTGKTCTASRMLPMEHRYLENTLPAIEAAFGFGADTVEIDVQRTADDRFAVFHDWTLDCRTEASGRPRDRTLSELQKLDVGYGYTPDGGRTWPFRGKGVGMMPSLEQVLTVFSDHDFIIDIKSNDLSEGKLLAERLAVLSEVRAGQVSVYGGPLPVEWIRERLPGIRTMSRPRLKSCLLRYIALGWSGVVPEVCDRGLLFVPVNIAPWLWGWPHKLVRRMERVGTRVILIGDYAAGDRHSRGLDDPGRVLELPPRYSGGIWTDRINLIGPAMRLP